MGGDRRLQPQYRTEAARPRQPARCSLKQALNRTYCREVLGFFRLRRLCRPARPHVPRKHKAGFLGLNGVVVKSHGGTDALGFATAIDVAIEMVRNDLVKKIATDVIEMNRLIAPQTAPAMREAAG